MLIFLLTLYYSTHLVSRRHLTYPKRGTAALTPSHSTSSIPSTLLQATEATTKSMTASHLFVEVRVSKRAATRGQRTSGSLTAVTAKFGQQCLNIAKSPNNDRFLILPTFTTHGNGVNLALDHRKCFCLSLTSKFCLEIACTFGMLSVSWILIIRGGNGGPRLSLKFPYHRIFSQG